MATSGRIETGSGGTGRTLIFSWSRTGYSIENNTSTISYTLEGGGTTGGFVWCYNVGLTVNGSSQYTNSAIQVRKDDPTGTQEGVRILKTGTLTIPHNADGTKSFSASITGAIERYANVQTATGTWALDTIPRASTITANKTSVELGTNVTFTITRASTSFKHTIRAGVDGQLNFTDIATNVDTSYTWTLPTNWAQYFPNGQKLRIQVLTYSGSTLIGTKELATPLNVTPSPSMAPVPSVTVTDTTNAYTTYGALVKLQSKVKADGTVTLYAGTPIAAHNITIDGVPYEGNTTTQTDPITTTSLAVSYTVTDGRGLTGTATATPTVLDWWPPSITAFTLQRCDQDGTPNEDGAYCKVDFGYNIAPLNNQNAKTAVVGYKRQSASSYTPQNVPLSAYSGTASAIVPASTEYTYNIKLTLTDDFTRSVTTDELGTAFTLVDFHNSGTGLAFGKVAESPNLADFGIPINSEVTNANNLAGVDGRRGWTALTTDGDLNTVLEPGIYYATSDAMASSIANCPIPTVFKLRVEQSANNTNWKWQTIQSSSSSTTLRVLRRATTNNGSTWGSWRPMNVAPIAVTDCNDASIAGFYLYNSGTANAPTTRGGSLVTLYYSNAYYGQIAIPYDQGGPTLYIRYLRNGTLSPWVLIGGADAITETGTSGNWRYTKWSSGRVELWGKFSQTVTSDSSSQFIIGDSTTTAYPFAISDPITQATLNKIGTGTGYISYDYERTDYWSGIAVPTFAVPSTSKAVTWQLYVNATLGATRGSTANNTNIVELPGGEKVKVEVLDIPKEDKGAKKGADDDVPPVVESYGETTEE